MTTNIFIENQTPVPALPNIKDKTKVDVRYTVTSPYATIHIYWDPKEFELKYDIEEPLLNDSEKKTLFDIEEGMKELINLNVVVEKTKEAIIEYIDKTAKLLINELNMKVSEDAYEKIFYYLYRDFVGMNEIDALINDYFIEDIECNGVDTPIYIVHRIYRNIKTNIRFTNMDDLASFVEKLSQRAGKYISYASPILDGTLPDGSRVNATYTKDISSKGPTFTIRKFTSLPWTPIQLISFNTLSPEMLAYFWILIQYKSNILIAGGTSSGKTTLLNAVSFFIPPEARVVSIEDSVTGDSKIIIKEKEKIRNIAIKEFVEKKIDAEVMTLDKDGKILFVKPSQYIKHKVKKDIYEVLTATGRKVKVTKDHSLFSLDGNELKDIKPTELEENKSFIAVPRSLPIEGNEVNEINLMDNLEDFKEDFIYGDPIKKVFEKYKKLDFNVAKEKYRWWKGRNIIKISDFLKVKYEFSYEELKNLRIKSKNTGSIPMIFPITKEFLEFCGLWIGDGSYDNYNKNSVIISNVDKGCIDIFKKIAQTLDLNYSSMNDGGVSLRIHSTVFYKLMKFVLGFGGYSNTKKVPDFIFNLSNQQINHFIRGYFSADGCVKKYEVSCASQSYELLEGIQTLFLRNGIISRINDFERKDKCMNMSISSSENISKFKEIGFLQERKNEKLNLINFKATHSSTDIIPINGEKIKELGRISGVNMGNYLNSPSNIGRNYMQQIAPIGSEFNDLSHTDILWDRVKKVSKISSEEIEVFDLSIPNYEKFICNNIFVHNTRELNLPRENWLPSVSRSAIGVGTIGEVDLFQLLKNSFRQNPDYVIVGEVRGQEAFVLFQGMASGHASISTIHADSVDTVIKRLETPPIELSPTLINTLDCVAIMNHAIVKKEQTRRLSSIVEVINVNINGIAMTNTPFIWNPVDDKFYFKKDSKVFDKIKRRYGLTDDYLQQEFIQRAKLLYEMYRRKTFDFYEIQKVVNEYYKNPNEVLKRFGLLEPVNPNPQQNQQNQQPPPQNQNPIRPNTTSQNLQRGLGRQYGQLK
ncbi:MAG: ATPase, T2SS/T4P/T4SS family [Nanoarchaeota archaeon]